MGEIREVVEKSAKRYRESNDRSPKTQILNECDEMTGCERHYAAKNFRTEHLRLRGLKGEKRSPKGQKSKKIHRHLQTPYHRWLELSWTSLDKKEGLRGERFQISNILYNTIYSYESCHMVWVK